MRVIVLAVLAIYLPPVWCEAEGENLPKSRPITPGVRNCLQEIRARQLSSGAFAMTPHPEPWVEPYFAAEAALALLAGGDPADLPRVKKFLNWYAGAIDPALGVPHPTAVEQGETVQKPVDSIDSYAGLNLLVTARLHARSPVKDRKLIQAARQSLQALQRVIQQKEQVVARAGSGHTFTPAALRNGLPINTGGAVQHLLMDAIEAYAGLRESVAFFESIGLPEEARLARELANGIAAGIPTFESTDRYCHVVMNANDPQLHPGAGTECLANLFAMACVKDQKYPGLWSVLKMKYTPDNVNAAECPAERWLLAARRAAPDEVADWEQTVENAARQFDGATYLNRLSISALALIDGSARYPLVEPLPGQP